eukprot:11421603-Ditylum_brightwellii.AAC.1
MALEQLSEIFNRMTNTSKDNKYTPYTVSPMNIPKRIKTVDTTPPPRVQTKIPHIIPPDDLTTPSPRVQPRRSPRQHQGPHIIPQCNMAQHHYLSAIPPYFVNAVYKEDTGKMEEYRQLIKGKTKQNKTKIVLEKEYQPVQIPSPSSNVHKSQATKQ